MQNIRSSAVVAPRLSARVRRRRLVVACLALLILAIAVPRIMASDTVGPEPRVHVVSAGETLWSMASHYAPGDDPRRFVREVKLLNDLEQAQVFPGQTLTLPPAR